MTYVRSVAVAACLILVGACTDYATFVTSTDIGLNLDAKTEELGITGKSRAVTVLIQCIFTDDMSREIKARTSLLRKVCSFSCFFSSMLCEFSRSIGC